MEKQVNRTTDDLISRAETVRMIEEGKKYQQDADDIAEMIDNMPSAQQWLTGEPTEDGDYLVYKYGDDDDFNYFDVDTFYTHEGTVEYGTPLAYRGWQDDHDRVVAWMPLPEPPEVEE